MAVRRFIAGRRHPTTIYSNNGTNLVVAGKKFNEGIQNLNTKLIADEMIDRGINWKFSHPSGAHFDGVWQRLVASCKRSLLAVLQKRSVTDDILLTVMKEVSSLLNTRQITHHTSHTSHIY
jgi:hypothetical protein